MTFEQSTSRAWPLERLARAKDLWESGLSASQVSSRMCREGYSVTRNAIIGQAHRRGWGGAHPKGAPRFGAERPGPKPERKKRWKPPPAAAPPVPAPTASPPPKFELPHDGSVVAFMELRGNDCRWPVAANGYCGGPALTGKPYCAGHCRLAYQPAGPRRVILPRPSSPNWR